MAGHTLISIDISGDVVYITEGTATPTAIEAHKCDEARLPEGTIQDGDIKNHASLVMTITKLLNSHSYKSTSAVITFTSEALISRKLSLPPGKPSETSAMVRSQMMQAVSDAGDYVFEYSYASPVQQKNKACDVWAYGLDKAIVEKYYDVLKSIHLRPVALDIHANCIEKLIYGNRINNAVVTGRSTLFVDIERNYIEIHLFNGYERAFSRVSPVSASEFLLVASNLGYGRPAVNQSVLARRLLLLSPDGGKKENVTSMNYNTIDISPEFLEKDTILAEAAQKYTSHVADELMKMVQFQMMRNSSMPVGCVYIYGGFSVVKGLDQQLSQLLNCQVEVIRSLSKVKIDTGARLLPNANIEKYINAIGALIRL